jgi:hypothetical protein
MKNRSVLAAVAALALSVVAAPSAQADDEGGYPVGPLSVVAVQPTACSPGYVELTYDPGADFFFGSPEAEPVEFDGDTYRREFPEGFDGEVWATARQGYYVPGGYRSWHLDVAPPSGPAPVTEELLSQTRLFMRAGQVFRLLGSKGTRAWATPDRFVRDFAICPSGGEASHAWLTFTRPVKGGSWWELRKIDRFQ